jgi:hypothetical protein
MKKITTFFLGLLVILLQSCGNESNPTNNNTTTPPPTEEVSNPYYPLVNGSQWAYQSKRTGPFSHTVAGDIIIQDITYKRIEFKDFRTSKIAYSHVRHSKGGTNIPRTDANGNTQDIVFIKGDLKVGDKWSNVGRDGNRFDYTCSQVGIQKTVQTQTYSDVVCIESVVSFDNLGSRLTDRVMTTYFAKGVGMIEQSIYWREGGMDVIELISYSPKR